MALQGNDLALLTARFGVARFGASRFGFIPCPEDVEGAGADEPGEYIWREVKPPTTEWTIVGEDCVCRNLCTLSLGAITPDAAPIMANVTVSITSVLTGVLGLPGGVAKINWGDGGHDKQLFSLLENDQVITFSHRYNVDGAYTITLLVHDERGCEVTATLGVTVTALDPLAGDFTAVTTGAGAPGQGLLTLTPTITGGSGNYSYAWSAWTEFGGSEGAPAFTDTDEIGLWSPLWDVSDIGIQDGEAKLIVTDTDTMLTLTIGPKDWDWVF